MAGRQMVPDAITLPDPENAVRALADISLPLRAACCGSRMLSEPHVVGAAYRPRTRWP